MFFINFDVIFLKDKNTMAQQYTKAEIGRLRLLSVENGGLMFVQSEKTETDAGIGSVKSPEFNNDGTLKYPELVYYCKLDGFYNWKKVISQ